MPLAGDDAEQAASRYVKELTRWRELRGLSKKALAERMAYDRTYLSHIESGRLQPTEDFARRAEEILATGGALWGNWQSFSASRSRHARQPPPSSSVPLTRTAEFIPWVLERSGQGFQEVYNEICALAEEFRAEPPSVHSARSYSHASISRQRLVDALASYYGVDNQEGKGSGGLYRARVNGADALTLSLLVRPEWLGGAVPLGTPAESFRLVAPPHEPAQRLSRPQIQEALRRLALVEVSGTTVLVNNPLYRLIDVEVRPSSLRAAVTITDFLTYALTNDLLEAEITKAVGDPLFRPTESALPLRSAYLPSLDAAMDLHARHCVGGPVALMAIARRTGLHGERDYLLLIQERSSRVLNVAGKLAVIPKAFHQPTGEQAREVNLSITLQRELEEELFGRQDLEYLEEVAQRRADPLHEGRVSEAARWLLQCRGTDSYRMECLGFGINMVTGNYEFPCLIVIEDEEWWDLYGHEVRANWEALRIHRHSSLDAGGLATLAADPQWSNEGLFAFLEALRRLKDTDDTGRVSTPTIEVEL